MTRFTFEELEEAIRVKRTSVRASDLQALLRSAGFSKAPLKGGSHEHWKHPCGVTVGLINTHKKDANNFDFMESVRDAIRQAMQWDQEQGVLPYAIPDWLTDEVLQQDRIVLHHDKDAQVVLLAHQDYPECAVAVPLRDLDKGRYMAEVHAIRADTASYRDILGDIRRAYDIERVATEDGAHLRVNGSGVTLPLPATQQGAIALRDGVLGRAISVAQDEQTPGSAIAMVAQARRILHDMGCDFEEREGIQWAVLPRHLANYGGENRNVGIPPEVSPQVAEKLLGMVKALQTAHKMLLRRQNEMFDDLAVYGWKVSRMHKDAIELEAEDGAKKEFHRDRAGCVDIAEVRQFSHAVRDALGMAGRIRAERALPEGERSL